MSDVTLERSFPIPPKALFDWIAQPEKLAKWFGPEGMDLSEHDACFSKTGPWFAVLIGRESGDRFKVSGQVTHVDPPVSVGITWAWHDPDDRRGDESHVTFRIEPEKSGAKLIIDHRDLADAEAAESHTAGWVSTLRKLENIIQNQGDTNA